MRTASQMPGRQRMPPAARQQPARAQRPAPRAFSWTVFPVVLGGSVAATLGLMARGVDPTAAFAAVTVAAYALILGLERIFPAHREWLHSRGDLRVDVSFALADAAWLELLRAPVLAGGIALGAWLAGHTPLDLWPRGWPVLAQLGAALVVAELPKYWLHRLEHERDWLWRFHATHHSVPRLYWLNASRFHPVDIGLDYALGLGPLVALGCGAPVLALFLVVSAVHGAFQHANLELRCGPLNWIFSMAELHRWHHSRRPEEANHNYGQNLIVWDVVFGTRHLPAGRVPSADVGLSGLPRFPKTFLGQLASPLRWRRIRGLPRPAPARSGTAAG